MIATREKVEQAVDQALTRYHSGTIRCYPYVSGAVDRYKQRTKSFGTLVTLVGRAIIRPTPEKLTVIGNDEQYAMAFLFSRLEMRRKFPSGTEGEWISTADQMWWRNRRFKVEKVAPTGQVFDRFTLLVVLANSLQGNRDA